jgi:hypothetical protein
MTHWKKFVIAADPHGIKQDKAACNVFFDFVDRFKPQIRIHAGDNWDFSPLRNGASPEEKRESMRQDYDAGFQWITKFKPHYYLRGNHCERLWRTADQNNGVLSDYAQMGVIEITALMKRMKCEMRPYHKREGVLQLGSLKILHGFFCGVNAAAQHARFFGNCHFGHTHTIDEIPIAGLERRAARGIGCLCQLDMEYNSTQPSSLRHAHGFAYGIVNERTGKYHSWQAEEIEGSWAIPSDIVFFK